MATPQQKLRTLKVFEIMHIEFRFIWLNNLRRVELRKSDFFKIKILISTH
jgi:hypothetical protein